MEKLFVVEPLTVDLGVDQDADEVVLERLPAAVGDHAALVVAVFAESMVGGDRPLFGHRAGCEDHVLRPGEQRLVVPRIHAQHVSDHDER